MGMAEGPSSTTVLLFRSGFVQHTLKRFPLSHQSRINTTLHKSNRTRFQLGEIPSSVGAVLNQSLGTRRGAASSRGDAGRLGWHELGSRCRCKRGRKEADGRDRRRRWVNPWLYQHRLRAGGAELHPASPGGFGCRGGDAGRRVRWSPEEAALLGVCQAAPWEGDLEFCSALAHGQKPRLMRPLTQNRDARRQCEYCSAVGTGHTGAI